MQILLFCLICCPGQALVSGPALGERPGPYSFVVSQGEKRGQLHCFVCEAEDRPMVILFARVPSPEAGKLAARLDQILLANPDAKPAGWVTFLAGDASAIDTQALKWSRDHALRALAVGYFEDPVGPPSYSISPQAELTVLVARDKKVVHRHAFAAGGPDMAAISRVGDDLEKLLKTVKTLTGAK